jgi:hypothetical protein
MSPWGVAGGGGWEVGVVCAWLVGQHLFGVTVGRLMELQQDWMGSVQWAILAQAPALSVTAVKVCCRLQPCLRLAAAACETQCL